MDTSLRVPLWIVAGGVLASGLYALQGPLTQFALAIILWLAIDGFAAAVKRRLPFLPRALTLPVALILVLGVVGIVAYFVAVNIGQMAARMPEYQQSVDSLIQQVYTMFKLEGRPPQFKELVARLNIGGFLSETGSAASNVIFILIFLGFLFSSAAIMSKKLDAMFPQPDQRDHIRAIVASIRTSMERYLWVQTVASAIDVVLTYFTLVLIGMQQQDALFWSFLIFFLNYIPTIGSIIAVVLPTAFALVAFHGDLTKVALTAFGIGFWQFSIGNFILPRMTGQSLNLSATIVLLALAVWSTVWGMAGAFLAAPLTVMMMIVFAQFPDTRWIAIMLSADGRPTLPAAIRDHPATG